MSSVADPFDLARFVNAQDPVIDRVRAELAAGRKTSHWMWFVFPQFRGLGNSPTSQQYAIASLDEARAYLAHPILGPRLRECTSLVQAVENRTAHQIFGSPDDLKFRSCLTLFAHVSPKDPLFADTLRKYYRGEPDAATITLITASAV